MNPIKPQKPMRKNVKNEGKESRRKRLNYPMQIIRAIVI
jgi:hypothetical protein